VLAGPEIVEHPAQRPNDAPHQRASGKQSPPPWPHTHRTVHNDIERAMTPNRPQHAAAICARSSRTTARRCRTRQPTSTTGAACIFPNCRGGSRPGAAAAPAGADDRRHLTESQRVISTKVGLGRELPELRQFWGRCPAFELIFRACRGARAIVAVASTTLDAGVPQLKPYGASSSPRRRFLSAQDHVEQDQRNRNGGKADH
jgi:hypothetical protein